MTRLKRKNKETKQVEKLDPKVFIERNKNNVRKASRRKFKLNSKKAVFIVLSIILTSIITSVIVLFLRPNTLYISPLGGIFFEDNKKSDIVNNISEELNKNSISYVSIDINNEYYKIYLNDKSEVVLSRNKSLTEQIASLQFILNRLTMEGRSFCVLDLRFDRPVIKF